MSKHPPIDNNTRVLTTYGGKRDYDNRADDHRMILGGLYGRVIGHSDSHGLCYEVMCEGASGTKLGTAWFDSDELEIV